MVNSPLQGLIDTDGDGFEDLEDDCPGVAQTNQTDRDGDLVGDVRDAWPFTADHARAELEFDLATCLASGSLLDEDRDGEVDPTDLCPGTPSGAAADSEGCTVDDFCGRLPVQTRFERRVCRLADFMGDEAVNADDCMIDRGPTRLRSDDTCVPR